MSKSSAELTLKQKTRMMAKNLVVKLVVLVFFLHDWIFLFINASGCVCAPVVCVFVGFFSRLLLLLVDDQTKRCILTQFSVQIRRLFTSFTTVIMYFDGGSFFHSLTLSLSFFFFFTSFLWLYVLLWFTSHLLCARVCMCAGNGWNSSPQC